jgi:hypothetical protein
VGVVCGGPGCEAVAGRPPRPHAVSSVPSPCDRDGG